MIPRTVRDVFLRRLGLERSYRPPALLRHTEWNFDFPLKLAVAYGLQVRPSFTFLQVGAFDGVVNDSIQPLVRQFGLRGIVVEPQLAVIDKLKATYAAYPQVSFVNAAISDARGTREFFIDKRGPVQHASLQRSHMLKFGVPPDQIESVQVPCVTIAEVLAQHGLQRCDLIQIDAEGNDYDIVRAIDFAAVNPLIIRFERDHMNDAESEECLGLLAAHGYRFIGERHDIIALRDR